MAYEDKHVPYDLGLVSDDGQFGAWSCTFVDLRYIMSALTGGRETHLLIFAATFDLLKLSYAEVCGDII